MHDHHSPTHRSHWHCHRQLSPRIHTGNWGGWNGAERLVIACVEDCLAGVVTALSNGTDRSTVGGTCFFGQCFVTSCQLGTGVCAHIASNALVDAGVKFVAAIYVCALNPVSVDTTAAPAPGSWAAAQDSRQVNSSSSPKTPQNEATVQYSLQLPDWSGVVWKQSATGVPQSSVSALVGNPPHSVRSHCRGSEWFPNIRAR